MKVDDSFRRRPRIEMIALIDIVFLVLVVFIYAMFSMAVHRGLPVNLPASTAAQIEKEKVLAITMRADGSVFVDQDRVSLDGLTKSLANKPKQEKEKGILLFADKTVSYQVVFQVLDRVRRAGINQVSLQAELDSGP